MATTSNISKLLSMTPGLDTATKTGSGGYWLTSGPIQTLGNKTPSTFARIMASLMPQQSTAPITTPYANQPFSNISALAQAAQANNDLILAPLRNNPQQSAQTAAQNVQQRPADMPAIAPLPATASPSQNALANALQAIFAEPSAPKTPTASAVQAAGQAPATMTPISNITQAPRAAQTAPIGTAMPTPQVQTPQASMPATSALAANPSLSNNAASTPTASLVQSIMSAINPVSAAPAYAQPAQPAQETMRSAVASDAVPINPSVVAASDIISRIEANPQASKIQGRDTPLLITYKNGGLDSWVQSALKTSEGKSTLKEMQNTGQIQKFQNYLIQRAGNSSYAIKFINNYFDKLRNQLK